MRIITSLQEIAEGVQTEKKTRMFVMKENPALNVLDTTGHRSRKDRRGR